MRIAIGQVFHETNTFSSETTNEKMFRQREWLEGIDIIQEHRNVKDYLGGMIDGADDLQINIIPTLSAVARPSGIILEETWQKIKKRLIDQLKQSEYLDAICLSLHGAGVSEKCDDIEGELLEEIRNIFGENIPIVCTLDLHANLTERMIENSSLLLGVKYYPHTDGYDRGREAIYKTYQLLKNNINPQMHLTKLPLMIPTSTTVFGPANEINKFCKMYEEKLDILNCTFYHGFPYSDTKNTGVSVLTISNGDKFLAQQVSNSVADEIWEKRSEFMVKHLSPKEGLELALQYNQYPVLINETSDNPGAGTPGDGTFLLSEMLKINLPQTCFAFIRDPEVVEKASVLGVGATISIELGGKTDKLHGMPLQVKGYVKLITDGEFTLTSPMGKGQTVRLGRTVRLKIGNVDVIVTEIKSQLLDDELLKLHGIDMNRYKIIGIKSSQHFRAFFQNKVPKFITVDSSGLSTFNFENFQYKHLQRPIYPLDQFVMKENF